MPCLSADTTFGMALHGTGLPLLLLLFVCEFGVRRCHRWAHLVQQVDSPRSWPSGGSVGRMGPAIQPFPDADVRDAVDHNFLLHYTSKGLWRWA